MHITRSVRRYRHRYTLSQSLCYLTGCSVWIRPSAPMPPRNDSREFWNRLLHGSRMTEITELTTKKGVEDSEIKVRMRCPPPSSSGSAKSRSHQYTFATYLKAAWALVLTNNSSASAARGKFDVVFTHGITTRSIAP